MRDLTKVVIGFGSIWGLFSFGVLIVSSFTIGVNDTAFEIIGIALYGLTFLPACILAIWFPRCMGIWLITIAMIVGLALLYQTVKSDGWPSLFQIRLWLGLIIMVGIPMCIGSYLFRYRRQTNE